MDGLDTKLSLSTCNIMPRLPHDEACLLLATQANTISTDDGTPHAFQPRMPATFTYLFSRPTIKKY